MSGSPESVGFERDGGVLVARLTRPDRRNAMTPAMLELLARGLTEESRARSAGAVLLAADGPVFCSGFDLALCKENPGVTRELLGGLARLIGVVERMGTPVVAAVQGAAIAGGCALITAATVVVADRAARFGYPVARLGLSPAVSGPTLQDAIGAGPARERLLSPSLIDGAAAHRLGLVHTLVETPGEVFGAGMSMARELAAKPRGAVEATLDLLLWLRGAEEQRLGLDRSSGAGAAEAAAGVSLATADSDEYAARLAALTL